MVKKLITLVIVAIFTGISAGALSSLFLHGLNWVSTYRQAHLFLVWGLPVYGLLLGLLIKKIPHHVNQGVPYLLAEIDNPKAQVSVWMAPFIFLTALGTHLFGGSAGREGVGVIMGASVAHALPRFHQGFKDLKPFLVYAGMAAGFSSIFGTPWAAIIFAFELHGFKDLRQGQLLLVTILTSWTALLVPHVLGPVHQHFAVNYNFEGSLFFYLLLATLASALGGHFFYWGMKGYTRFISQLVPQLLPKLMVGGLLISLLVYFTEGYDYIGIGTDIIARSFHSEMTVFDFLMKGVFTIMTLSIGFKGGEVTPLFFMGATLSNGITSFLGFKNFALSSSLGMVGLFGAVSGAPLASAVMGAELFGPKVGILCLVCCFFARILMGNRSIYRH